MIYSTCTFNTKENEENVKWILENFDAEIIAVPTLPDWGICGSLLEGFDAPVYRFIPGLTRSEGLFVAVMRKGEDAGNRHCDPKRNAKALKGLSILFPYTQDSPGEGKGSMKRAPAAGKDIPAVNISYDMAISYLRRQAITLAPDVPRGLVRVCFQGHPLGLVKNIGSRANNLYPKPWRIRTTHIPQEYENVLKSKQ